MMMIVFLFTGCSFDFFNANSSKIKSCNAQNYINLCKNYENNYECVVGAGHSYSEAIKNSKLKLAQNALTIVQSSFETNIKEKNNLHKIDISKMKKFSSLNFTHLELKDLKIVKKFKKNNCYYSVVIWNRNKVQQAINEFMKKADAIMYVNLIKNTDDLNLKLKYLTELNNIVRIKHLENDTVALDNTITTFSAYINLELNSIYKKILPIFTGNEVYLVTRTNYFPIKNITISLKDSKGHKEVFITDEEGKVQIPLNFKLPINIYLHLSKRDFLIGTLEKNNISRIYISTKPLKIAYNLYKNGHVIATGITPNMVEVYPKKYDRYKIVLLGSKKYRRIEQTLNLKPGFDAYFFREMQKIRYGKLDLQTKGDAVLTMISSDGRKIAQDVKELKGKEPVGEYKLIIKRKNDSPEYQIVRDNFIVNENKVIKRTYFEPRDRIFKRFGYGIFLGFSKQTPIEVTKNGINYEGDKSNYDQDIIYFGAKKYWTYTFLGGGLGFTSFDDDDSTSTDNSDMGLYFEGITGIYAPIDFLKGDIELGVGYEYFSNNKTYSSYDTSDYKVDVKFHSPFVSLKINAINGILGFEIRKFSDKDADIQFIFSLGIMNLLSKYELSRSINAQPYKDYEEN